MKQLIELNANVEDELKKKRYAIVVKENGEQYKCKVKDIKKGYLFMLFEADETPILDNATGCRWFIAFKNSKKIKESKFYNTYFYPVCEHTNKKEKKMLNLISHLWGWIEKTFNFPSWLLMLEMENNRREKIKQTKLKEKTK